VEGEHSEFGSEDRGWIWHASLLERLRHGGGEAGGLERVALLQPIVSGDNRSALGPELAPVRGEAHRSPNGWGEDKHYTSEPIDKYEH
jgi:hypothetical protein